jgi:hypothetical protein
MSKGRSELNSKHQSKITYTGQGVLGPENGFEVFKEVVVRVKSLNAFPTNRIKILGRVATDKEWLEIGEVYGNESKIFHIASWDYICFECSFYNAASSGATLLTSGFFNDGMFITEAISSMNQDIKSLIEETNEKIGCIEKQIEVLKIQIGLITDHEGREL